MLSAVSVRLGLFNACPHALSLTHELVVKGRRRTNLNVCPTCHQTVDDTLVLGIVTGPQMDLNTNIDYLDSQRKMLQNQINGAVEELRQSEITVADVAARLAATHDYRNSLRGDVSTGMTESRAIVRRQIQIELELSNLQAFNSQAEALMFTFGEIADRLAANQGDRRALPKETYSDVDVSRISLFEKNFRGNASSFGYRIAYPQVCRRLTETFDIVPR